MNTALQPIEHPGRFERLQLVKDLRDLASEMDQQTRPEVLGELERHAPGVTPTPAEAKVWSRSPSCMAFAFDLAACI